MGDDLRLVYLTGRTSAVDKYPLAILKAIKIEPFDTRRGHVIHVPVEKYFPLRGNGGGIGAEAQCQPGTVLPIQACERCSLENRVTSHSGLPNFVLPYPTMERRKHHGTQAGLLKPAYKIAKLLKGCNFSYVTEIKTPQR